MANIGEREQLENGAGAATAVAEPPPETQETTETDSPETQASPESGEPKRGRGRPRKPPKAEEPTIGFFGRLRNLSRDEWENHMAYLYRTQPLTDAKKGGASANYVTKYGQAFDEEVVKHECGSGGYKILLNQIGSDGKSRTISVHFFDILDPKFPPKIMPGAWLDDPRNDKWAWAKAAYDTQGKTTQPAAATVGASDMPGALHAVGEIIKVLKPGDGASADPIRQLNAISELLDRQKPEQPAAPPPPPDPVAQFAALAKALKDLRPETAQNNNDLIVSLMAQNTALMTKITEMRIPAPATSNLTEMLGFMLKLKDLFPSDTQNPWIAAITTVADKLGPAAEAYAEHRAMHPPDSAATGQPSPEAASRPDSAGRSDKNREAFSIYRNIMIQVSGPMIAHVQNGQPGSDFAIWFVDGYGPGFHKQLQKIGKEQIMHVIASIPEVWGQLQPMEDVFSVFLTEFLAWNPQDESDQTIDMPPVPTTEPTQ